MLETIWFILWGVLWAVYFILDGFDLGLGGLLHVYAKRDEERRIVYNCMGPFWDGNEVWLIAAGGVTFAAFPRVYAAMFSTLYTPLLLLLFALILRGSAFEFRRKIDSGAWRMLWDLCLAGGSLVAALLFGVAFANIFRGLPFDASGSLVGGFPALLNLYGLAGGLFFLSFFWQHGTLWLILKGRAEPKARAIRASLALWGLHLVAALIFGLLSTRETGILEGLRARPAFLVLPILSLIAIMGTGHFIYRKRFVAAWVASSTTMVTALCSCLAGLFPVLIPSLLEPSQSLTAFNSCSSPLTLKIMLVAVALCLPLVILYQGWVYRIYQSPLTEEDLNRPEFY
ncbi:MAG: cytochrome d ubiquinol oxidase subunit II [Planctomycetes bacterium]|nr:cytochrome d ubiquinol oxidase subunit II [Planctomycetota bacterium]